MYITISGDGNEVGLVLTAHGSAFNTKDNGQDIILIHISSFYTRFCNLRQTANCQNLSVGISPLHTYYIIILTQSQILITLSHTFEECARP